jgi:2-iminobutanoate/2-iminopropanoate deaminase
MRSSVRTDAAPAALGPYSQAVRAGQFLFVSGQLALNPATGAFVEGGIGEQTRRVFQNIGAILDAGGASLAKVVRATVYLADITDFAAMNEVYATFFAPPYPARSTIQAAKLPKDARIEVDVIAYVD